MWYRSEWLLGARPPVGALKWGRRSRQRPRPHKDRNTRTKPCFHTSLQNSKKTVARFDANNTQNIALLSDSCNIGAGIVNKLTQQGAWPVSLGLTYASMRAGSYRMCSLHL